MGQSPSCSKCNTSTSYHITFNHGNIQKVLCRRCFTIDIGKKIDTSVYGNCIAICRCCNKRVSTRSYSNPDKVRKIKCFDCQPTYSFMDSD